MTELATVFEDADLIDLEPVIGHRAASTPETRERYAFLKTKRQGSAWEEDNRLYVTWVFRRASSRKCAKDTHL
jgi:hypothetical protein